LLICYGSAQGLPKALSPPLTRGSFSLSFFLFFFFFFLKLIILTHPKIDFKKKKMSIVYNLPIISNKKKKIVSIPILWPQFFLFFLIVNLIFFSQEFYFCQGTCYSVVTVQNWRSDTCTTKMCITRHMGRTYAAYMDPTHISCCVYFRCVISHD